MLPVADADADEGDDAFPGLEPCRTARAKAARAELAGSGKLAQGQGRCLATTTTTEACLLVLLGRTLAFCSSLVIHTVPAYLLPLSLSPPERSYLS
jgi:hypothetical protein